MSAPSASSYGVSPCDCLAHRLGNAADQPDRTRRYGSDLTDAEWAIVRPLLPVPSWLNGKGGRPHEVRAIIQLVRGTLEKNDHTAQATLAKARAAVDNIG